MKKYQISLTCLDADFIFPYDEDGNVLPCELDSVTTNVAVKLGRTNLKGSVVKIHRFDPSVEIVRRGLIKCARVTVDDAAVVYFFSQA